MKLTPITPYEPAHTTEKPISGASVAAYLAEHADDNQAVTDTTP